MKFVPHNYQRAAINFVEQNKSSALLLDCGLGKTAIVYTAITDMIRKRVLRGPVLVVAPKLVVGSWVREGAKWDHTKNIPVVAVVGNEEERIKALRTKAALYVVSRDNIAWLAKICDLNQFSMLVMDESSSFKDETSARTAALIGYEKPRKVILTGTPMPKNLEDLYSQYKILDGGKRLGRSINQFRERFMIQDSKNIHAWKPLPGAQETVFARIKDITISMKSDELLDLPPVTMVKNEVFMTPEEQAVYNQLATQYCLEYDGVELTVENAGILTNKLAQLSNGFFYDKDKVGHSLHTHKLEALESLLEASVGCGEDVVIAYNFQEDKERTLALCSKLGYRAFDLKENKEVEKFICPGDSRVALLHPKCGMGLNIQEYCHRLIWYSLPYSYEEFYQTLKRVYRQGQKKHTFIHQIECANSYDQRIKQIVTAKGECNEELLQSTKWAVQQAVSNSIRR